MTRATLSRWTGSVVAVAACVYVLVITDASAVMWIAVLVVAGIAAWSVSPLRHRDGPTHRQAVERADAGGVVVYWRPGCMFCSRLRRSLGTLGRRALWVNIWADAEAADFVRSVNDGNETVPTVVAGSGAVWTNPAPDRVAEALRAGRSDPV